MIRIFHDLILIVLFLFVVSCQEGLSPSFDNDKESNISYINGTLIYEGGKDKFPDSNSVFGIFVAAFKVFPKDSSGILNQILSGNVYLQFESQPYPVDSSHFTLEINDPPVNIEYLACTMQTDSIDILKQRVIGVYSESGDNKKPSELSIEKKSIYNIIIKIDFDNLPPQPF